MRLQSYAAKYLFKINFDTKYPQSAKSLNIELNNKFLIQNQNLNGQFYIIYVELFSHYEFYWFS